MAADAPAREALRRVLPRRAAPEVPVDDAARSRRRAPGRRTGGGAPAAAAAPRSSSNTCASRPSKLTALRNRAGMIRSVSMSSPRSATALPVIVMSASGRRQQAPHVDHFAGHRRRGHHRRAHQQRAAGRAALPALEVAVRRGRADLAALEPIRVHREAHRAAGLPPLEPRLPEDLVQALALGRVADPLRPRHDQAADVLRDPPAPHDARRLPQIGQPAVRAGADERDVHLRAGDAAPRAPAPCTRGRRPAPPARAVRDVREPRARARPTPTDWPGLVPHVTIGARRSAVDATPRRRTRRRDPRRSSATTRRPGRTRRRRARTGARAGTPASSRPG